MGVDIFQFIVGCVLLYYGAEFLVKGSKQLALKFKIPSIIIGITVVALGTSLPELVVSVLANIRQNQGMVIGNVMGSNITNIGLVLGLTALISEVRFSFSKIRYDMYFFLVISFLPIVFIMIGGLFFWQGIFFLFILGIYLFFLINFDRIDDVRQEIFLINNKTLFLQILIGTIGLSFGATYFVEGAKGIATYLGVSDLIIGMSIVALGTSLPELAASIASIKHGENEFVIGNVIGSNIMNIVFVLGLAIMFGDIHVTFNEVYVQSFFLISLSLIIFIMFKLKNGINQFLGLLLMISYLIFIYFNFSKL